jgi:hypothetical protein
VFGELLPSFNQAQHGAALERVLARLAQMPGVARIVRPPEVEALGYPDYADNHFVPGQYIVVGEIDTYLTVDPKAASSERKARARPAHTHGYLPDHPSMFTALVLSGAGIAPGRTLGHVGNVDVAPTIAALLGVDLPRSTGRVLREAMR